MSRIELFAIVAELETNIETGFFAVILSPLCVRMRAHRNDRKCKRPTREKKRKKNSALSQCTLWPLRRVLVMGTRVRAFQNERPVEAAIEWIRQGTRWLLRWSVAKHRNVKWFRFRAIQHSRFFTFWSLLVATVNDDDEFQWIHLKCFFHFHHLPLLPNGQR